MNALVTFRRRVEASMSAAQRELARDREAARLGIEPEIWRSVASAPLDLELLRALHRAVTGDRRSVRQALGDGEWALAEPAPGKLRPKAQAFRIGDHLERAWEQSTLRAGLVELLRHTAAELATDPLGATLRMLVGLGRAQPFVGDNERTALTLAAWALRHAGLPALAAFALEREPAYTRALVAAVRDDHALLSRYLIDALWDEALALAEWIGPVPPPDRSWTLANEHAALAEARSNATGLATADVEAFAIRASDLVERELAPRIRIERVASGWLEPIELRMQETWNSAMRGHAICPHEPIRITRWRTAVLEIRLAIASAGRGITGALSAQLALEVADSPVGRAPAMVLVPDEDAAARDARLLAWVPSAIERVLADSPLRV